MLHPVALPEVRSTSKGATKCDGAEVRKVRKMIDWSKHDKDFPIRFSGCPLPTSYHQPFALFALLKVSRGHRYHYFERAIYFYPEYRRNDPDKPSGMTNLRKRKLDLIKCGRCRDDKQKVRIQSRSDDKVNLV
jgi:hypothetical protein